VARDDCRTQVLWKARETSVAVLAPLVSHLGGSASDFGYGIAVDFAGNAHVTGYSSSINFPVTPGAFQTTFGGVPDAFVTGIALRMTFASLIRLVKQFDTNHDVA